MQLRQSLCPQEHPLRPCGKGFRENGDHVFIPSIYCAFCFYISCAYSFYTYCMLYACYTHFLLILSMALFLFLLYIMCLFVVYIAYCFNGLFVLSPVSKQLAKKLECRATCAIKVPKCISFPCETACIILSGVQSTHLSS